MFANNILSSKNKNNTLLLFWFISKHAHQLDRLVDWLIGVSNVHRVGFDVAFKAYSNWAVEGVEQSHVYMLVCAVNQRALTNTCIVSVWDQCLDSNPWPNGWVLSYKIMALPKLRQLMQSVFHQQINKNYTHTNTTIISWGYLYCFISVGGLFQPMTSQFYIGNDLILRDIKYDNAGEQTVVDRYSNFTKDGKMDLHLISSSTQCIGHIKKCTQGDTRHGQNLGPIQQKSLFNWWIG